MGSFGDGYSPTNVVFKKEQDRLTDQRAKEPEILDVDIVGGGLESAPKPHGPTNQDWPTVHHQRRGSVAPNVTDNQYLEACAESSSPEPIIVSVCIAGRLILEYGKYRLAARVDRESTMRKKGHLCNFEARATLGGPALIDRSESIRTMGMFRSLGAPLLAG